MTAPTVLVVEDDPTTRMTVRAALAKQGFTVVEANDGRSAMELMTAHKLDLVLLDLMLPDVHGFEVARRLQSSPEHAEVPVIAFSSSLLELERARRMQLGIVEFLIKPVESLQLVETIKAYLAPMGATVVEKASGACILAADDNPIHLKLLRLHLEENGYRVMTARDGVEVLEAARRQLPDAVLSDVLMPRLDGFRLCLAIREDLQLRHIPVVLMTGASIDEADRELAGTLGANALVSATPDCEEAFHALRAALKGAPAEVVHDQAVTEEHAYRLVRRLERQATASRNLTRRVAIREAELGILAGLVWAVPRTATVQEVLDTLLSRCLDFGEFSRGAVYLADREGRLRFSNRLGFSSDGAPRGLADFFGHLDLLEEVLHEGQARAVRESTEPGRPVEEPLRSCEARSLLLVPILSGGERLGVIVMAASEPHTAGAGIPFSGAIGHQVGLAITLTRAVSSLREKEEHLERIVETLAEGLLILDSDGRIKHANAAAGRILKLPQSEIAGHTFQDGPWMTAQEDGSTFPIDQQPFARAIASGEPVNDVEQAIIRPDGERLLISMSAAPLRDAGGAIVGAVASLIDITEQKRATDRRRAAAKFRALLESAPDAMVIADPDGTIVLVNSQTEKVFGYTRQELLGAKVEMLLPEHIRARHSGHRATYFDQPVVRPMGAGLDLLGRRKDGSEFPVEVSLSPIQTEEGVLVSSAIRDVTERRRAEEARSVFVALVESSDDAIISTTLGGIIVSWNPGAERIYGYPAAAAVGRSIAMIMSAGEQDAGMQESRASVPKGAGVRRYETVHIRKDGTEIDVSVTLSPIEGANGKPIGVSAIVRAIGERKRLEKQILQRHRELSETTRLLNNVLESSTEYSIIAADLHGNILTWNEGAHRNYLYTAEEMVGRRNLGVLQATQDHREDQARLDIALRDGKAEGICERLRKDGSRFTGSVGVTLRKDAEGAPMGFLLISKDITEERRQAEALAHRTEELARSNQELEQFAYVASHDLQEPLRMVTNYTQLLAKRYQGKLDADADEFIAFAVDGATRMQKLINDLLAFSRAGRARAEPQAVDCAAAFGKALQNLHGAIAAAGAAVTHDVLPTVQANETQIVQLFQNLVGNAIKFRGEAAPRVHVSAAADGAEWTFSIRDNGIGIDPQEAERIFVIFQRLHGPSEYPGTGIGLAICKKIVERHGGRIWVESKPGEGAKFCFTMPSARVSRP